MQEAFLTVKYKLYNLSGRHQALLLDAMRRAHLEYDKLLRRIRPNVEGLVCQIFAMLNANQAGFRN